MVVQVRYETPLISSHRNSITYAGHSSPHVNLRLVLLLLLAGILLTACAFGPATQPKDTELILATTTSTQDSGLLDVLVPRFEDESGLTVKVVAVGTGAALKMGREGNADVLLVHAPSAEHELMAAGHGSERLTVMHNDFVIVGPSGDPAGIAGMQRAADALAAIADRGALFVSRGDDSGTYKKETALWASAGIQPAGAWYQETGQGMGATLRVASEKRGYTLTDRGTYLNLSDSLDLQVLVEGNAEFFNPYHVIVVNPEMHSAVNAEGARQFAEFLTSQETQETIAEYGVDRFGQPLFVPDAIEN